MTEQITYLAKVALSKCLIGKPVYKVLPNGYIIVQIPYFSPSEKVSSSVLSALGIAITRVCARSRLLTNLELRLIQIKYPYLESSILAQYMARNASKYNFTRMQKRIFRSAKPMKMTSTTSALTGVRVELSGRLTTQRSIPRKTVESRYTGSFTVNKQLNSSVNLSQYTSKNKLGAYTVKV